MTTKTQPMPEDEVVERRRQATLKRIKDEAIGADDPRAKPYVDDLKHRDDLDAAAIEERRQVIDAASSKHNQARAKVAAAARAEEEARRALDEALIEQERTRLALVDLNVQVPLVPPAEELCPGERTTMMVFPRQVTLNAHGKVVTFPAGIHAVPESLQTHWFLVDSGVRPFAGNVPREKEQAS